jgi:hypothetical protein
MSVVVYQQEQGQEQQDLISYIHGKPANTHTSAEQHFCACFFADTTSLSLNFPMYLMIYVNVQFSLTIPTPFHQQNNMKPPLLLLTLLALAVFAPLLSVQSADVAVFPVGDPPSETHLLVAAAADGHDDANTCDAVQPFANLGDGLPGSDSPPLCSLPFQPFRLDDWGLMYLDYWRGEHFRSNAQVISLSLLGLFAAMAFVVSPWRTKSPPPSDAESPYSIFIRTISSGTKCMDVLPSETLGSVKQRLKVRYGPFVLLELSRVYCRTFDTHITSFSSSLLLQIGSACYITYDGRILSNSRSLVLLGIDRDATLHVRGRLLGGMPSSEDEKDENASSSSASKAKSDDGIVDESDLEAENVYDIFQDLNLLSPHYFEHEDKFRVYHDIDVGDKNKYIVSSNEISSLHNYLRRDALLGKQKTS